MRILWSNRGVSMNSISRACYIKQFIRFSRSIGSSAVSSNHEKWTPLLQKFVFLHSQNSSVLVQNFHQSTMTGPETVGVENEESSMAGFKTQGASDGASNGLSVNAQLLSRINVPRNQSILPVLHSWIEEGNELGQYQMKAIFTRLEWYRKYKQALEVSEWLLKEKPFPVVEFHYARWIYYTGKVHGPGKAEEVLSTVPVEFCKEVLYCRIFDIYLEYQKVDKAEEVLELMKNQKLNVPTYIYNNLITFYDKNGLQSRISTLLEEMERDNVPYNTHTYNILLACSSRRFDIENLENVLARMKSDTGVRPDFVSYTTVASAYTFAGSYDKALGALHEAENSLPKNLVTVKKLLTLISLYGSLKKGEDVKRNFEILKAMPGPRSIPSYVCTIEAYGETGCVENAEEIAKEMEMQTGWYHLAQYNSLLGVYCKLGMMEKAEEVLKNLASAKHKPNALTYTYLLIGYLKSDQHEKALKNFDGLLKAVKSLAFNWEAFVSREWLLAAKTVFELIATKGDPKCAKLIVDEFETAKFNQFPRAYHYIKKTFETSFDNTIKI